MGLWDCHVDRRISRKGMDIMKVNDMIREQVMAIVNVQKASYKAGYDARVREEAMKDRKADDLAEAEQSGEHFTENEGGHMEKVG